MRIYCGAMVKQKKKNYQDYYRGDLKVELIWAKAMREFSMDKFQKENKAMLSFHFSLSVIIKGYEP